MTGLVADASALVKCLVEEPGSPEAVHIMREATNIVAPDLVYAECANALWKRARRGGLSGVDTETALARLTEYPMEALPLADLTADALGIALRFDHSIYDCYYVAAAIQTGHTLVTADRVLAGIAREVGLGEQVLLLGE
ncbi:MAG: type II toxin-antitoxin system VapC family toxin [Actinomycetota bacterium]|nr:MAG: PilT domain-containing [Actinomycetota bacterium]MDO8950009.1 type II toxin-antitoxin system VapC family toxin [Actinomycetota bacterium]MDP3630198.1 type II toxin-antitoxin system VapC family toxin [Actinomycetota bacterium]